MKKIMFVIFVVTCTVFAATSVFAGSNPMAYFMFDTDLTSAGNDNVTSVSGIGSGENVGFAIYVKNYDFLQSFKVDFEYFEHTEDINQVTSGFGLQCATEVPAGASALVFNGQTGVAEEANILGDPSILPATEIDESGHYFAEFAQLGTGASASSEFNLIYFAVFQTGATVTTDTEIKIKVQVIIGDNVGGVKDLGYRYFLVNPISTDVKNTTWGKVKKLFKDF